MQKYASSPRRKWESGILALICAVESFLDLIDSESCCHLPDVCFVNTFTPAQIYIKVILSFEKSKRGPMLVPDFCTRCAQTSGHVAPEKFADFRACMMKANSVGLRLLKSQMLNKSFPLYRFVISVAIRSRHTSQK